MRLSRYCSESFTATQKRLFKNAKLLLWLDMAQSTWGALLLQGHLEPEDPCFLRATEQNEIGSPNSSPSKGTRPFFPLSLITIIH